VRLNGADAQIFNHRKKPVSVKSKSGWLFVRKIKGSPGVERPGFGDFDHLLLQVESSFKGFCSKRQ